MLRAWRGAGQPVCLRYGQRDKSLMAKNKRKISRALYDLTYSYTYWARRNVERFEAGDPAITEKTGEYFAARNVADNEARAVRLTEQEIERAHTRGQIDALLRISDEGGYFYREYFVAMERADTPGEYAVASWPGDAPDYLQDGRQYTLFQLTDHQALVNCYFAAPIEAQEALLVVTNLIAQKQLGNYGVKAGDNQT